MIIDTEEVKLGQLNKMWISAATSTNIPAGYVAVAILHTSDTKYHTLTYDSDYTVTRNAAATGKESDTTSGNCLTHLAGTWKYGRFITSIQLHSGSVEVYLAKKAVGI